MSGPRLKFLLGGLVIVGALIWLGFIGYQESKAFYITVEEFHAMQGQLHGKTVKVAGDVVTGSIDRSKSPMEFSISSVGQTLKVRYIGKDMIPDTFMDQSKAVVEGSLGQDGVFQARRIEAKCASKYEAEYEKKTR
jgi:cytochrome c-type biogenesis protein CcmE